MLCCTLCYIKGHVYCFATLCYVICWDRLCYVTHYVMCFIMLCATLCYMLFYVLCCVALHCTHKTDDPPCRTCVVQVCFDHSASKLKTICRWYSLQKGRMFFIAFISDGFSLSQIGCPLLKMIFIQQKFYSVPELWRFINAEKYHRFFVILFKGGGKDAAVWS